MGLNSRSFRGFYQLFPFINESYFQDSLFLLEECGHSNPDRCSVRSLDVAL